MVGVDFVELICYLWNVKKESIVYLVLYVCRLVYLEFVKLLDILEFVVILKWFIVWRGRFEVIYLDNGFILRL